MEFMVPLLLNTVLLVLALVLLREFRIAMLSIRALRWRLTPGNLEQLSETPKQVEGELQAPAKTHRDSSVRYNYVVEEQEYRSEQVAYGYPPEAFRMLAQSDLQQALENAPEVTVYYDPRKPEVSVLMNGFKRFHAARMLLILVVFIVVWVAVS